MPYPNNRVELRYYADERRSEILTGGVPAWTWAGLKPVLDAAQLDALYINFLSGWELDLETTQLIRQHFRGPIYCDLHMLAWAVQPRRSALAAADLRRARVVRLLRLSAGERRRDDDARARSMALAATALHAGVRSLTVTLGKRGVAYFAPPDFDRFDDWNARRVRSTRSRRRVGPVRTALVAPEHVVVGGDPTGCGDVWGSTYFSRLLAGDNLGDAILAAHRAAARNVEHRGASGLANHLRGKISLT